MYCHIDDYELVSYALSGDRRSLPNPVVRWLNPLAKGALIDIEGDVSMNMNGVEFVLARWNAADRRYEELFTSNGSEAGLTIEVKGLEIKPGDQIVYSARIRELLKSKRHVWLRVRDGITITLKGFVAQ
jgi:hypothetical protein